MSIIVGDIHGNVEKAKSFLGYRPDQEHVALGDYLDSFTEPPERQLECLQLLLDSSAVLLWGNHDLQYLQNPLFHFAGYNLDWVDRFQEVLENNISRFLPAYVADGWLCTHAGVSPWLAGDCSVDELDQRFNVEWQAYLADRAADGRYRYKSIFSFDFMCEGVAPASIKQVHGHDEHSEPGFTNQHCASIGNNDPGTCWIFDSEANIIRDIGL